MEKNKVIRIKILELEDKLMNVIEISIHYENIPVFDKTIFQYHFFSRYLLVEFIFTQFKQLFIDTEYEPIM